MHCWYKNLEMVFSCFKLVVVCNTIKFSNHNFDKRNLLHIDLDLSSNIHKHNDAIFKYPTWYDVIKVA